MDLFTEENLDSIWMYEDIGNRLLKREEQDVDEICGELMVAREALKYSFGKSLNGVGGNLDQLECCSIPLFFCFYFISFFAPF